MQYRIISVVSSYLLILALNSFFLIYDVIVIRPLEGAKNRYVYNLATITIAFHSEPS
jgi:hypothetical protein